jgi:hypothetical protein|nr:MAG TPA: hypothetical protein [Caudoviricetes sp.]
MNKFNKYLDMKINREFYKGNFYEDLILDLAYTVKHPYASIRVLTNDLNRLIKNAYYNIENEKIIETKLKKYEDKIYIIYNVLLNSEEKKIILTGINIDKNDNWKRERGNRDDSWVIDLDKKEDIRNIKDEDFYREFVKIGIYSNNKVKYSFLYN